MRRIVILVSLGLVCAAGMISFWASSAAQQVVAPAVKLSIKEVPIGKKDLDKHTRMDAVSPDGKHVAYFASGGKKWRFVIDGVEGKQYDERGISDFVFSPDGKRFAYKAQGGIMRHPYSGEVGWMFLAVVVDGVEGTEYDGIGNDDIVFSPDGRHVAYVALRGKKCLLVVDGAEGKEYEGYRGVEKPVFSPDGRRLPFVSGNGSRVVVDGVEGTKYKYVVPPTFSPDSQHVVYKAWRTDKWVFVVDGVEAKEAESKEADVASLQGSRVLFDSTTQFHTYASRGNEIVRLEVEIATSDAAPSAPK